MNNNLRIIKKQNLQNKGGGHLQNEGHNINNNNINNNYATKATAHFDYLTFQN